MRRLPRKCPLTMVWPRGASTPLAGESLSKVSGFPGNELTNARGIPGAEAKLEPWHHERPGRRQAAWHWKCELATAFSNSLTVWGTRLVCNAQTVFELQKRNRILHGHNAHRLVMAPQASIIVCCVRYPSADYSFCTWPVPICLSTSMFDPDASRTPQPFFFSAGQAVSAVAQT